MRHLSILGRIVTGRNQRRLASTLRNPEVNSAFGRVIVSGIQPTGIPHVREQN